jgi:hypothetical protein
MANVSGSTRYLAEVFAPQYTTEKLTVVSERVREAAHARSRSDEAVRFVSSLLVQGEETAFFFFEALRADAVEGVLRAAGVDPDRISKVIPSAENGLVGTTESARSRAMGSHAGQLEGVPRAAPLRGDEEDA